MPLEVLQKVLGTVLLTKTRLEAQTLSMARADALRQRLESACPGLLRHRMREHLDPLAGPNLEAPSGRPGSDSGSRLAPEEAQELVLEYKKQHYADWADQPLPILGGKTPRDAVKSAHGRRQVDALLKDMERSEQRLQPGSAFDFSGIRDDLGL